MMESADQKKGRRKSLCMLPDSVLQNKTPMQAEELVQGYKILQKLLNSKLIGPFLDEPDEKEDEIMATYYEVIDDPMWFTKVKEKYLNGSYSTLPEFVLDVRKILANCFRFHGPKGHLTKSALKLEAILEQELKLLPEDTQAVCSLESTHNFKDEDLVYKKDGVRSLLLQWVINEQSEEEMAKTEDVPLIERKEKLDNLEKEIVSWENGILYSEENVKESISCMYELPQVGQFLSVSRSALNLENLTQYEVERMLLVPQFSKSLAILMTALLSRSRKEKSKLLFGPPMPYEIWSSRLSNKVSAWYRTYHYKKRNFVEVLNTIGVEHMFWLVMGEPNPLDKFQFHELILQKRVWILKTLCDTIMHNQKTMYDLFSNKAESNPQYLGEDRTGNSYIYFPAFSDLRVYRQAKSTFSKFNITRWERLIRVPVATGDEDSPPSKCVLPSRSEFELIATSVSELKTVYTNLIETEFPSKGVCDKNSSLLENIDKLLQKVSPNDLRYQTDFHLVRQKMYQDWKTMYERSPESVSFAITYWEKSTSQDCDELDEKKPSDDTIKETEDEPSENHILRERKSKTDSHISMKLLALNEARGESDTSDETDDFCDDSEEEWVASQSRKKQQGIGKKRRRSCKNSMNGDEAQEMVEKNMRKNQELVQQKKDEKSLRLNNNQTVISRDDALISEEPKKVIQIKCKEAYKLLKNVNDRSVKTESISVIQNLVAPANIKAEGGKNNSPETIDIDDDEEDGGKKKEKDENCKTINLSLRIDQPGSMPAVPSAAIDDDIEVLETTKPPMVANNYPPTSPATYTQSRMPSPATSIAAQPQYRPRGQVPLNQIRPQGMFYVNAQRMPKSSDPKMYANSQGVKGGPPMKVPYANNNLTPIKQAFPVVRSPRMMQHTFRGMAAPRGMSPRGASPRGMSPRMPGQVRAPRQRMRFNSPSPAVNSQRGGYVNKTMPQPRFNSSQATFLNNVSRRPSVVPTTPPSSNSLNSRATNFSPGTQSKAVSNILNSVAIANTLSSSGKRKSSLLNSITITPINNSAVTITPVLSSPNQGKNVSRNLGFSSSNKSNRLVYIKGTIVLDSNDFCYSVQIADGRKFKLTPEQLEECRDNNNGVMPTTISIPVPEDVANLLEPEIIEID